ncbi:hypothetical protein [Pseudotabrizicola formosa]|uniref:hypothetical protein n=1 Tax=Pseudotabrizicola formosa TaxID=2030009 RepID=UPI000CCFEBCE|nr:hypothetical protein [Pseudotabrizicola formosa]
MPTIQEQFGQAAINTFVDFCRADIRAVADLEAVEFAHVADPALRRYLAQTHYGARWLYKLGLSVLVQGDESIAHVRTQVIDYGSICEALLSDCILHGIRGNAMTGTKYLTKDGGPARAGNNIGWNAATAPAQITKRNFWWLIEVAGEEGILTPAQKGAVTKLRKLRNTVHITELATTQGHYYRTLAKLSLGTVQDVIAATRAYKVAHP